MSWMKRLVETYDTYQDLAGVVKNDQPVLLPISHSTVNAQIEVIISEKGDFVDARAVEKGDEVTIIPVTEDSSSRSSSSAPHPLCDKLCYVAGDYSIYTTEDKTKYYDDYLNQLRGWTNYREVHPMVLAVYNYLKKANLIRDLVASNVLKLDEEGKMLNGTDKIQGIAQKDATVRFQVYMEDSAQETRVWRNVDLYHNYIAYYRQCLDNYDLCYVLGTEQLCSDKHPSKIRNAGDKAKLVSGNDTVGFTYRGRFAEKTNAVSIGYVTSQKAHNALKWLIQKQGYTKDDFTFVSWVPNKDVELPDLTKNSSHACDKMILKNEGDWLDYFEESADKRKYDTGKKNAEKLNRAIQGYARQLGLEDYVIMMSLEAATTGRISITYYDEINGEQYITALQNWYSHCIWQHYVVHETAGRWLESTPSPREIALACYGVMRDDKLDMDSKLMKSVIKRILPCITKNKEIPNDMIKSACRNTSRPMAFYHKNYGFFIWENQMLYVTCALIRYRYEKQKGDQAMATFLEDNMEDRNVLFGRLLAILEYMEERAMFEKDEHGKVVTTRQTNAKRYWAAYSRRPAATFKILYENLMPYRNKLSSYEERCFEKWVQEVMDCLLENGYDNHALTENYLPAYYMQMKEMKEHFFSNKKQVESKGE